MGSAPRRVTASWLDDKNGGRVADAIRAAARHGVTCRVMVDALGSGDFVRGPRWCQLREAGVHALAALEDIPRLGRSRREGSTCVNHRKCAPRIDNLLRCEGPVVRQAQHLFVAAWIAETVKAWPLHSRLIDNVIEMASPVL